MKTTKDAGDSMPDYDAGDMMPDYDAGDMMPDYDTGEIKPHDKAHSARSHVGMPKKKKMHHSSNKRIRSQRR